MQKEKRNYSLLGTSFVLDEEKILREGRYDLDDVYKTIEEIALKCQMIKIDKNRYHTKDNEHCLADLSIAVDRLANCSWFTLNVKEWIWISQKEGDHDIISRCKEKYHVGVWR